MGRMVAHVAVVVVVCASGPGCYRYDAASLNELAPNTDVRARVSAGAAERLRPYLGSDGRLVEGLFVGRDGDRVLVEVPAARELRGMHIETLRQRVDLAPAEIVELEVKALDRGRTYLVVGLGAAVVAAFVIGEIAPGGGSRPPGDGEPPGELRLPRGFPVPFGR